MNALNHPMPAAVHRLLGILLLLSAWTAARSQQLEDSVFTVGTVTQDKALRHWAYVLVQPTRPDLLAARKLAVYRKAGESDSAAAYQRRTILTVQTDPAILSVMLQRGASLGDDLGALSNRVDNLFAAIMPAGSLTFPEKLGAVIRGSLGQPQYQANLLQLGRLHPAVNLGLGLAAADDLPAAGTYTYEVRDFDLQANVDRAVLGRVTVTTGQPVVLPAPGAPFEVRDPSGKGHLNVKLRWATSPEFRRLSLLGYGFNLYRVDRAFAEAPANKFHLNPPSPGILHTLAGLGPQVELVNHVPILASQNLSDSPPANADSVANPTNRMAFVADDHGLASGGVPFRDGDAFYYFVAGRDLLGRDGTNSAGTLVVVCDRIPPDAPRMPKVSNHYDYSGGVAKQRLQVSWKPVQPATGDSKILGYHVYRWKAPAEIAKNEGNPALHRANAVLIPHVPGQASFTFIDEGVGAPDPATDANKTFWYSVRAVDGAACDGGNLSPNSPPAFGVLREFTGPDGPSNGGVKVLCCDPSVTRADNLKTQRDTTLDPDRYHYDVTCTRADTGIAWAEFWFGFNGTSNYVGRIEFKPGESNVVKRISNVRDPLNGFQVSANVSCRVGAVGGKASPIATLSIGGLPPVGSVQRVAFQAITQCQRVRYVDRSSTDANGGLTGKVRGDRCVGHTPQPPQPVGDPKPPKSEGPIVVLPLTPTTQEFRLYRRVDFGPLTLVKQGQSKYDAVTNLVVEIPDNDTPANSGVVCYYGQLFDEHGNPSPLVQLGDCAPIEKESPTPMLAPLEPQGDESNPRMRIRWFCPASGVERFEVWLGTPGQAPVDVLTAELSGNQGPNPNPKVVNPSAALPDQVAPDFGVFLTPQPGLAFGSGAAFDVSVPIKSGRRYYVFIRVVKQGGEEGHFSNVESLLWKEQPTAVGPQVPWPARPLPDVTAIGAFHTNVAAIRLKNEAFDGVGVLIGLVVGNINDVVRLRTVKDVAYRQTGRVVFVGGVNPDSYLFQNAAGDGLLPVALYRYQVPSAAFPKVSGDVVQVSPLMEKIASRAEFDTGLNTTITRIYDPYIQILSPSASLTFAGIYLLDTQPVVVGARYAYLLVRFDPQGEVIEVIPTQDVEVTP